MRHYVPIDQRRRDEIAWLKIVEGEDAPIVQQAGVGFLMGLAFMVVPLLRCFW